MAHTVAVSGTAYLVQLTGVRTIWDGTDDNTRIQGGTCVSS